VVIAGVDLMPGSSPLGEARYAVVIMVRGEIRERRESLRREDLIRLLSKYKVDVLAVDNIYELATDAEGIASFLSSFDLPPRLVEVTRIHGKQYSLETIASFLGLAKGKLPPLKTAEIVCKLASMDIGSEVLVYEEETRILVRRARLPIQGGMSRERFRRNIELAVLRRTREIRETLKRKGVDFDLFVDRGEYGLKGSMFIVYAPLRLVKKFVKERREPGCTIKVKPVLREKLEYVSLRGKAERRPLTRRYIIVGVDPGMWTGVAIIDLRGHPISVFSKRWMGRSQIIREIQKHGRAALIATDVNPPPVFVKKLATSLNAPLFYPSRSLTIEEKRALVEPLVEKGLRIRDSHQRDALAAALKAYKHNLPKFRQVEKELRELNLPLPSDEVKSLVLKGLSVKDSIRRVAEAKLLGLTTVKVKEHVRRPRTQVPVEIAEYVELLEKKILELEIENEKLRLEKAELQERIEDMERFLEGIHKLQMLEIKRDRAIQTLRKKVESLSREVASLKNSLEETTARYASLVNSLEKLVERGFVWGYVLPSLNKKALDAVFISQTRKIPILVLNPTPLSEEVLEALRRYEPECILSARKMGRAADDIRRIGIPVIEGIEDVDLLRVGRVFLADKTKYLEALEGQLPLVERLSREEAKKKVLSLIKSYREERSRVLRRSLAG